MTTDTTNIATSDESAADIFNQAANQKLSAARAELEAAKAEKARLDRESAESKKAVIAAIEASRRAEEAAKRIVDTEVAAAQKIREAKREILPPAVTAQSARRLAETLLAAIDAEVNRSASDDRRTQEQHKTAVLELNNIFDDVTAALLTNEIEDDARATVLGLDGVVLAFREWQQFRGKDFNEMIDKGKRRDMGADVDPCTEHSPADSRLVIKLANELRDVLSGAQRRKIESVGELLAQNVSPNQIASMLGYTSADGAGDIQTLGIVIDRALARAGHFREVAGLSHLARLGAINRDDAWAIRQQDLQQRRERFHNRREVYGRDFDSPMVEAVDTSIDAPSEMSPEFRRAVASYQQAAKLRRQTERSDTPEIVEL